MPRPTKCRRVCSMPRSTRFAPDAQHCAQEIVMAVDEYETIRLIDLEGLTQEQCAEQMEVARTTAQAIYARARKKLAECIVQGRPLQISGGDVKLCPHQGHTCRHCCGRHGHSTGQHILEGEEQHENRGHL